MLAALFIAVIVVGAMTVGLAMAIGLLVRVVVGLILLPLRLLGWVLLIPLLLVKTVFMLIAGLGAVVAVAAVAFAFVVVASVFVPLLPVLAVVLLIWVLVRASSRPAAV